MANFLCVIFECNSVSFIVFFFRRPFFGCHTYAHICVSIKLVLLFAVQAQIRLKFLVNSSARNNDFSINTRSHKHTHIFATGTSYTIHEQMQLLLFACCIYMQMFLFYEWITIIYSNSAPFYCTTYSVFVWKMLGKIKPTENFEREKNEYVKTTEKLCKIANGKFWHSENCNSNSNAF